MILSNEIHRSIQIFLFPFRSADKFIIDRRMGFLFRVIDVSYKVESIYIYISMARRIIFIIISIAFLKIDRRTGFMVFATNLTILLHIPPLLRHFRNIRRR